MTQTGLKRQLTLFDAVMLKSLPVKNPDELFIVNAGHYPVYQALKKQTAIFSGVTINAGVSPGAGGGGNSDVIAVVRFARASDAIASTGSPSPESRVRLGPCYRVLSVSA